MAKIFLTLLPLFLCHPIHLTVTNIEYIPNKKYFVIQVRFFKDDLEKAIYLQTGKRVSFTQKSKDNNKLLLEYIRKNLQLVVNGHNLTQEYDLQNYELQDITLWAHLRVKYKVATFIHVDIIDRLMLNLYPDQQNLLIFAYKNYQKGLTFNRKHTQKTLSL